MRPSNTRNQDGGRTQQSTSPLSTRPLPPRPLSSSGFLCCAPFRMPSVFNIVRACIYGAVLVWTIICLGIAAHFQNVLATSELTRFVPFAIFVCSASMLLMIALLGFGFWRDRNPISTRVELGCLGLAGVLWLALGAFLVSSDSGDADVECYSSAESNIVVDMPGFSTETFQAQYRVLEAFSIFNIILIWLFLLFLLFLALRHHRWGNRSVWLASVTAYPWFAGPELQNGKLPAPVSAKRTQSSRSRSAGAGELYEKRPSHRRAASSRQPPTRNEQSTHVFWIPHTPPEKAYVSESRRARPTDKYHRDASPRR
jgi:hypothetical protein